MKVEAPTLEEAIIQASKQLNCSTLDLDMKVIQHPSSGILGFFKKNAIIETRSLKDNPKKELKETKYNEPKKEHKKEVKTTIKKPNFNESINDIKHGLNELFNTSCFEVDVIEVNKFDNTTIFIKLDGKDAALLIGKEGHRYKALSYLLHSWINFKYGYYVRLEIAEFFKNQEDMISAYLVDIIQKVESSGKAQTKPLDGVLVKIALNQLRQRFPDKYVGVKNSKHGKFIVINERRDGKK